jgi:hypothetical protein
MASDRLMDVLAGAGYGFCLALAGALLLLLWKDREDQAHLIPRMSFRALLRGMRPPPH